MKPLTSNEFEGVNVWRDAVVYDIFVVVCGTSHTFWPPTSLADLPNAIFPSIVVFDKMVRRSARLVRCCCIDREISMSLDVSPPAKFLFVISVSDSDHSIQSQLTEIASTLILT